MAWIVAILEWLAPIVGAALCGFYYFQSRKEREDMARRAALEKKINEVKIENEKTDLPDLVDRFNEYRAKRRKPK